MTAQTRTDVHNERRRKKTKTQAGFSMMQLLITLGVVSIVSGLAFMGITSARQRIRLTNSSRMLASYVERARVDSVRRHPLNAAEMAGVEVLNTTTYRVKMDFDGDGTVETRDITLDDGVVFATDPLALVFDWRGRLVDLPLTEIKVTIAMQWGDDPSDQRVVDVTRSGDVTIDSDVYLDDVPNVNVNVNALTGIDSGSTINGNNNPNPSPTASPELSPSPTPGDSPTPEATPSQSPSPGASPTPTPSPGATPTPTPTPDVSPTPVPSPTPCTVQVTTNPSPFSFSKQGSGTISFTMSPSGSVQFTSGPNNLGITKGVGNAFAVNSLNNTRGNFTLVFATPCGSRNVSVTITN
jgi:Tfp pilus assembly protein FimT